MLGTRGPQRGLFEADTLYGEFVGRQTFYGWLASQRGELFPDELFLGLYISGWGRPSVPPSLLATALVLQTYEGVSDEEATARAAYDVRWKVALGIELDTKPFAKSTLQEFRAQLVLHEEQRLLFQQRLEAAKRRGKVGRHRKLKLALDTTPILGRGAGKDTYNLLADGIVAVLRVLAAQAGVVRGDRDGFVAWATAAGYGRYVGETSVKGQAAIEWDDVVAREHFLGELVAEADRLLEQVRVARGRLEVGSVADATLAEAAGLLSRVLAQDIDRKTRPDGPPTGVAIHQGTAPDRLVAIHDPEMRHGRKSASKRFDGHKGAVAVDTDEQLITAVDVLAGNAPDAADALALVEQSEAATESVVEETAGDCAYGDGDTRQAFADAGRVLYAKVPALSNHGGFPKTAFLIELDGPSGPTCTCPGGHTTSKLAPAGHDRRVFVFPAATCAACPLRAQCLTDPNGGSSSRRRNGRTILLHPQEALLQAARAFQHSPAFVAVRRRRQAAEHRLARLVQLGIRQARYVGRAKTLFQLALAATVANLTLLAGHDLAGTGDTGLSTGLGLVLFALFVATWALVAAVPVRPGRLRASRVTPRSPPHPPFRPLLFPALATFRPDF
jgi:transposase